ncbi:hypothetical protein [Pseudonocardia sp. N23]|uniref:hypothetical protein n=1 Tax=Pseudonocardia sp. N23 TaxID=1987376 RepID=UPI000C03564B|nr:hypothetical protein [Pseudonocardia sp. N23]GAY10351.1 hypothetical protein TOK_4711 [Pseudonocardia sp. N23]
MLRPRCTGWRTYGDLRHDPGRTGPRAAAPPVLDAIAAGRVTRAYRRWDRARVEAGTRLRTIIGVLGVTAVEVVDETTLTDAHARHPPRPHGRDLARRALDGRSR